MKVTDLLLESEIAKAGVIPFIITDRGLEMMFMVSSNAAYGGSQPMIAKGHVDENENVMQAAIREGEEELGLRRSNIKRAPILIKDAVVNGLKSTYLMRIYGIEVKSKEDFGTPHFETARVEWMTVDDYRMRGRKSQLRFVEDLVARFTPA